MTPYRFVMFYYLNVNICCSILLVYFISKPTDDIQLVYVLKMKPFLICDIIFDHIITHQNFNALQTVVRKRIRGKQKGIILDIHFYVLLDFSCSFLCVGTDLTLFSFFPNGKYLISSSVINYVYAKKNHMITKRWTTNK